MICGINYLKYTNNIIAHFFDHLLFYMKQDKISIIISVLQTFHYRSIHFNSEEPNSIKQITVLSVLECMKSGLVKSDFDLLVHFYQKHFCTCPFDIYTVNSSNFHLSIQVMGQPGQYRQVILLLQYTHSL